TSTFRTPSGTRRVPSACSSEDTSSVALAGWTRIVRACVHTTSEVEMPQMHRAGRARFRCSRAGRRAGAYDDARHDGGPARHFHGTHGLRHDVDSRRGDAPVPSRHVMTGPWELMFHGFAFVQYDWQLGPGGGCQVG